MGDGTSEAEDKDAYTVGWICALPLEMAAAKLMLDEVHQLHVDQDERDHNTYILGQMQGHKVVIACLPIGTYGTNPAATVAKDMLRTFKSIRFGLLVGIGGGAPSSAHDIRLGDVVVSIPTGTSGGVIQSDRGKLVQNEAFERTGSLNAPPTALLTAAGRVKTDHLSGDGRLPDFLSEALEKKPKMKRKFAYQGELHDCLFQAKYEHVNPDGGCDNCDATQTVQREERDDADPVVHYGNIASGNQVIKHAETRDRLSKELGVLCFEMEAAGLMQEFSCLVIRGICDYSDSHKNKRWQEYAAATAAAYAKELLSVAPPKRVEKEKPILLDPQLRNLVLETKEAILHQTEQQETRHDGDKNQQCLNDLFQTDPVDDKKRILRDKGYLLEGSCQWIVDLPEYKHWKMISHGSRLWIRGDPGKGKTMLMCGIIEGLETDIVGEMCYYFFCQATDSRLNTATAVIRGLIHHLTRQHPWILSNVRERYDIVGKTLFEDANAWHALSEILLASFQDSRLEGVIIVIDALDECVTDRGKLLGFIRASSKSLIKWIVSSRNFPDIREALENKSPETEFSISLEDQQDRISGTIQKYIKKNIEELASKKQYDDSTRAKVESHLSRNANNTFLWVALVCQKLGEIQGWRVEMVLHSLPKGLTALYRRMLYDISILGDGILPKKVLAILSVLERPVTLLELPFIMELPSHISENTSFVEGLLEDCGSFLILRDGVVRFVHQSAVDFLQDEDFMQNEQSEGLSGVADRHHAVFHHSLSVLYQSGTLKRDIYGLEEPGSDLDDITLPEPHQLACLKYSCVHWVDHLRIWMIAPKKKRSRTMSSELEGGMFLDDLDIIRKIHGFLRAKFLYWIEAFILFGHISKGIQAIQKLSKLIEPRLSKDAKALSDFIRDANRFVLYNRDITEKYPLQLYASSLPFSPHASIVKRQFRHDIPDWIVNISGLDTTWSACLQTLTDDGGLDSLAFSSDGKWLASTSATRSRKTLIRIWEADSGILTRTLEGNFAYKSSISFSGNGKSPAQLAIASMDNSVQIWDAESGTHLRTFCKQIEVDVCTQEPPDMDVYAVAFSFDNYKVASHHADGELVIWDAESGEKLCNLPGHRIDARLAITRVAFSPDNSLVAAFADKNTVNLWNIQATRSPQILRKMVAGAWDVSFSSDSRLLALASVTNNKTTIHVWDVPSGSLRKKIILEGTGITCLAFSPTTGSRHLAVAVGKNIHIWDMDRYPPIWSVSAHIFSVVSLSFTPDGQRLASGTCSGEIKFWDVSLPPSTSRESGVQITRIVFSQDGSQAVYHHPKKSTIEIRNIETGWQNSAIPLRGGWACSLALSNDRNRIACATEDQIRLFDAKSQALLQTMPVSTQSRSLLAFNHENQIISVSHGAIKLWDGCVPLTFDVSADNMVTTCFTTSRDGKYLAYAFIKPFTRDEAIIQVLDAKKGEIVLSLHVDYRPVEYMTFSSDNQIFAAASQGRMQVWDLHRRLCLWTLRDDYLYHYYNMSFDEHISLRLHTQFGFVDLNLESLDNSGEETSIEKQPFSGNGIGLRREGSDGDNRYWIVRDGKKASWVPLDYQWTENPRNLSPFINGTTVIWNSHWRNEIMRLELKYP